DFLTEVPEPQRSTLLRELVLLDADYRRQQGETPAPDDYRPRFPELDPDWLARELAPVDLRQAGRYLLEGELGHGGMGVVYRAHAPDVHRSLAVKVLHTKHAGRPELAQRFLEEAQLTGQLQHPGVPPIHAIGRLDDGRPFFAMKLVKGRTLAELL